MSVSLTWDRVVSGTECAAGIVAMPLGRGNFAIEPAEQVNHARETVEMSFRVVGMGKFLEEDLGEASGCGLKADFRKFAGVVAAEEADEVILVETVLEDGFLFETPFEIAAGSPTGDVTFGDLVALIVECSDDVFVRDSIPEHAIDHVAVDSGEAGDAPVATDFPRVSEWRQFAGVGREGICVNHGVRLVCQVDQTIRLRPDAPARQVVDRG